MMKPEIKALWTGALRSGNYQQGRGRLRRTEDGVIKSCCLDVLCDVAVQQGVIPAPTETSYRGWVYEDPTRAEGYEDSVLPAAVVEWAGIDHGDPRNPVIKTVVTVRDPFTDGDVTMEDQFGLASLNDEYGQTFAELADLIDAQL